MSELGKYYQKHTKGIKLPKGYVFISGFNNKYGINKKGRVISLDYRNTGKIEVMTPYKDAHGYIVITLRLGGKTVSKKIHRLLCQTFKQNPNNFQDVNHKDGNKANNKLSNLEWCNRQYNIVHAYKNNLTRKTTKKKRAALEKTHELNNRVVYQYDINDSSFIMKHKSINAASKYAGIGRSGIGKACNGKYKHAGGFIWSFNNPTTHVQDK